MKALRKRANLKQTYISFRLNTTQKTISSWETGKRSPSIEQLPKLAEILNCSIEELVLAIIETKNNAKTKDLQS